MLHHPSSGPRPPQNGASPEVLPSMNALVCFLAPRAYYRETIVSTGEIFVGPDCQTTSSEERYRTIQSPDTPYDIRELVNQLPATQKPDLILVKADSTGRNQPRHLDGVSCPKVLLVGDTHHMKAPIRSLVQYATEERFDFVVFDHTRQHAHFFVEAGLSNVLWLPAFDLSPHEQPWREEVEREVVFVGQVGRFHPHRQRVLDALARDGVPVKRLTAPPDQAAALYSRSLINLNCSLNGDLNLRVFEVLSSGGFLLTDRLAPQAGLDRLFRDGEHLVCYDGVEDLRQKIQHYLAHPDEARRIARAGRDQYLAQHRPAQKIEQLVSLLGGASPRPLHVIEGQGRARRGIGAAVAARLPLYEHLQEMHRTELAPVVMFTDGVAPAAIADATDLPRLRIVIERAAGAQAVFEHLAAVGVPADRISQPGEGEVETGVVEFDVLVTRAHQIVDGRHEALIDHADEVLIESELSDPEAVVVDARLKRRGFARVPGAVPPRYRLEDEVTIGERHFAAGEPEQAAQHFQTALASDPENVRALNNLGVISHVYGDSKTCVQFLQTALGFDRRDPETLLNLAEVSLQTGQGDEARRLHRFLQGRPLDNPVLDERRATLQQELGGPAPAAVAVAPSQPTRRILLINNIYPPQELGGYGRLMQDFAAILSGRGHTLEVLSSDTAYLGPLPGAEPGIVRSLKLAGGWRDGKVFDMPPAEALAAAQYNAAEVKRAIARFQPDICLLGNLDFVGVLALRAALDAKLPVIHHLGNHHPGYPTADTPRTPLYRIATASRWLADHLASQGYPLEKVAVIYPGARVGHFEMPAPASRRRLRIAYASLVMPYKGAHILVDALRLLASWGVDFTCTVAGGSTHGEYVQRLKDAVAQVGITQRVTFPGNLGREGLKDLFGRCNVLAFPTQMQEPFGISQVEAMAAGLTVVTSGTGGSAEIVENGVSGLTFDKTSPQELAAALASLVQDRPRWQRMAETGTRRAFERFDIERSVDELERQFSELLAG
jgi:glycosyltransferase involved in cell wall biosynthesis